MDTPRLSGEAASAWARVSIHLNCGDVEQATAAAVLASSLSDWAAFGDYMRYGGPALYNTADLPAGWVWVEPGAPARRRVLMATSVMAEFGARQALAEFTRTVALMMTEPGFRSINVDSWRELRPSR